MTGVKMADNRMYNDLVAAEAGYNSKCRKKFFTPSCEKNVVVPKLLQFQRH